MFMFDSWSPAFCTIAVVTNQNPFDWDEHRFVYTFFDQLAKSTQTCIWMHFKCFSPLFGLVCCPEADLPYG